MYLALEESGGSQEFIKCGLFAGTAHATGLGLFINHVDPRSSILFMFQENKKRRRRINTEYIKTRERAHF
jgi:hypothetical protein